ncbi:MAG: hypothetical protein ACRCZI_12970 [Cetobacterium sp.]
MEAVFESYPEVADISDQLWMMDFLTALGSALPCEKCRVNFKDYLSLYPLMGSVGGRYQIKRWMASYKQWSKVR